MTINQELYFEDLNVGDSIPSRDYGPLTIVDTVRWAGGCKKTPSIFTTTGITSASTTDYERSSRAAPIARPC